MSDQIITRIDDMGNRIDDLEKSIADLMNQAGVEGPEKWIEMISFKLGRATEDAQFKFKQNQ